MAIDQGSAALGVAGITLFGSATSKLFSWYNKRNLANAKNEQQTNDNAYQRAESQASTYYKQLSEAQDEIERLRKVEADYAKLQAQYQQSIEDRDKIIGENQELRKTVQDLRTQLNQRPAQ